jgi:hypothetical protein
MFDSSLVSASLSRLQIQDSTGKIPTRPHLSFVASGKKFRTNSRDPGGLKELQQSETGETP